MGLKLSILSFIVAAFAVVCLLVISDDAGSVHHEASLRDVSDIRSRDRIRPCGFRLNSDPVNDSIYAERWSGGEASATPERPVRLIDLPGIVKVEPEDDVSIAEVSRGHCSATRIAENWFISAAHCVATGYDRIVLKAGAKSLSSDHIQIVPVDFAVCHSGFEESADQFENDLSLLYIRDEHVPAMESVPIVSWGKTQHRFTISNYSAGRTGGWGLKTYKGELHDFLQSVELDVFTIQPNMIRMSSRAGRGPCVGDSGGPLFVDDNGTPVLMGILSTISSNKAGEMCEGNYLSNYMNLERYKNWTETAIAACEANRQACDAS